MFSHSTLRLLRCRLCGFWVYFNLCFFTGRAIEDHELVMEVQSNWVMEEENKLYFRKNYAKYEFFKNPLVSPDIISVKWCNCCSCKKVFSVTCG